MFLVPATLKRGLSRIAIFQGKIWKAARDILAQEGAAVACPVTASRPCARRTVLPPGCISRVTTCALCTLEWLFPSPCLLGECPVTLSTCLLTPAPCALGCFKCPHRPPNSLPIHTWVKGSYTALSSVPETSQGVCLLVNGLLSACRCSRAVFSSFTDGLYHIGHVLHVATVAWE